MPSVSLLLLVALWLTLGLGGFFVAQDRFDQNFPKLKWPTGITETVIAGMVVLGGPGALLGAVAFWLLNK